MFICTNLLLDAIHWFKFIILSELFLSFSRRAFSKKQILSVVIALLSSLTVLFIPVNALSVIVYVLAVWGVLFLIYNEKAGILLIAGMWSMFLISLLDEMAYTLFDAFIGTERIIKNMTASFGTQIFTMCFLLLTGLGLKRTGKGSLKNIGIPYLIIFTVLVIVDTYVLTVLGVYIINTIQFEQEHSLRISYIIVVVGMFFQLLMVLLLIVSRNDSREKEKIAQKYLEIQIDHYQYLEQREKETKRFRHDLRSHMFALQTYMQTKQYMEMEQHLNAMYGTMESFEKTISVNNNIVDAILNKCDAECKQQGIQLMVKGHFPVKCQMTAYDLCTIFSNLLSNAREAAVKGAEHEILVNIRYTEEELLFHVENDYTGDILVENGKICTKKENQSLHGMGIENVKNCVEKNNGYMNIQTKNQRFIVKIILPQEA